MEQYFDRFIKTHKRLKLISSNPTSTLDPGVFLGFWRNTSPQGWSESTSQLDHTRTESTERNESFIKLNFEVFAVRLVWKVEQGYLNPQRILVPRINLTFH